MPLKSVQYKKLKTKLVHCSSSCEQHVPECLGLGHWSHFSWTTLFCDTYFHKSVFEDSSTMIRKKTLLANFLTGQLKPFEQLTISCFASVSFLRICLGHVLKAETTKRNHQNKTSETYQPRNETAEATKTAETKQNHQNKENLH